MQSIPAQDRPKVIAVVLGIVTALGFVVRNVAGVQTQAQSSNTAAMAMSSVAPSSNSAPAGAAPAETQPGATPTRPESSADNTAGGEAASEAAARDEMGAGLDAPDPLQIPDPFHPLEGPVDPERLAASAPAAARRSSPPPVLAEVRPASSPAFYRAGTTATEPARKVEVVSQPAGTGRVRSKGSDAAAVREHENELAAVRAGTAAEMTLVGTVSNGRSAIAVIRVGDRSLFVDPMKVVEGWLIRRIEVGQVWVSRGTDRRILRVGDTVPCGPVNTDGTALVVSRTPAEVRPVE